MILLECKNSSLFYEINELIIEYLDLNGLNKSLETFTTECVEKCLPIPSNSGKMVEYGDCKINTFTQSEAERMLIYFELGKRDDFFELWDQFLSQIQVTNDDMKKLEVYLHVHFSLWPKSHDEPEDIQAEALNFLRVYFEKNSRDLSNENAILPLFALPFVPDPKNHPIFSDLFEDTWTTRLKSQIEATFIQYFEKLQENISTRCKLALIVSKSHSLNVNVVENVGLKDSESNLMDSSPLYTRPVTPFIEINSNYHRDRFATLATNYRDIRKILKGTRESYRKLLRVSNELVLGLEKTLSGDLFAIEPVLDKCFQIFPQIFGSTQSQLEIKDKAKPDKEFFKKIAAKDEIDQNLDSEVSLFFIGISDLSPDNLDYEKIKQVLTSEDISYSERLSLLQALRWLITKSSTKCREFALESYTNYDILGISDFSNSNGSFRVKIFSNLENPQPNYFKECLARFLNSIASTKQGREYLSRNNYCLDYIISSLRNFNREGERESIFIYQMILAALQKLSLRKKMRLEMIEKRVIQLVVGFIKSELEKKSQTNLKENECVPTLNLYLIEYGWALLMNLCLHSEADKAISEIPSEILTCIIQMLFYRPKQELGTYVVSTLYSILKNNDVFHVAQKLNLGNCLETIITNDGSELSIQLIHILNSLNNRDMLLGETVEVEYDDQDCIDPEDFEPEIECEEKWVESLDDSCITGDDLLLNHYYLNHRKTEESSVFPLPLPHPSFEYKPEQCQCLNDVNVIRRPITPLNYNLLIKNMIKAKSVLEKRSQMNCKIPSKKSKLEINEQSIIDSTTTISSGEKVMKVLYNQSKSFNKTYQNSQATAAFRAKALNYNLMIKNMLKARDVSKKTSKTSKEIPKMKSNISKRSETKKRVIPKPKKTEDKNTIIFPNKNGKMLKVKKSNQL